MAKEQLGRILPALGLFCFILFHLVRRERGGPDQEDQGSFLERRLTELAGQFDRDADGQLSRSEVSRVISVKGIGNRPIIRPET